MLDAVRRCETAQAPILASAAGRPLLPSPPRRQFAATLAALGGGPPMGDKQAAGSRFKPLKRRIEHSCRGSRHLRREHCAGRAVAPAGPLTCCMLLVGCRHLVRASASDIICRARATVREEQAGVQGLYKLLSLYAHFQLLPGGAHVRRSRCRNPQNLMYFHRLACGRGFRWARGNTPLSLSSSEI